jgi:hypothetical protein
MLYKPNVGRFKDTSIFWHEGKFHLFSMYMHDPHGSDSSCCSVWSAVSEDGVHWKHLGPVIDNAPFLIFAMAVVKVGNRFILNHGSFTRPGIQNVIRFWESKDLVHWTYCGPQTDLTPDTRWYHPDSRLDCMDVVRVAEKGRPAWYGYATGPGGFLKSSDGLNWEGMPQPAIDWNGQTPPPTPGDEGFFEVGGCEVIDGKTYLLGGWFNYFGFPGYGVFTLIGDTPTGPFRADPVAYRLCGNTGRWIAMWARFIRAQPDMLINGYMYDGFTYECGDTYLPPIKKVLIDQGHLRLGYWKGNDNLKGTPWPMDLKRIGLTFPKAPSECTCRLTDQGIELEAAPHVHSLSHAILRQTIPTAVAILDQPVDAGRGLVLEGTIRVTTRDPRTTTPSIGFYLEETDHEGTAILLHACGRTEIGKMTLGQIAEFDGEDIIFPGCAAPAGIFPHVPHSFRLLLRKNMFEFYLDDRLVQTFNTTHYPDRPGLTPRRIGFLAQNGQGTFENLKAWSMNLAE